MELRKTDQLSPHPDQDQQWGDLPEAQFQLLVESMKKHGQRDPIDIDGNDRIIDGHQRWRAAKKLGIAEVKVRVVGDPDEAEELFLSINFTRRQLGPIQQAHAIKKMIDRKQAAQRRWERRVGEQREEIARILGISGRKLSRMLQLLRLPVAIQGAVERDELTQNLALKVERLPESAQEEIAIAIADGEDAAEVARDVLEEHSDSKHKDQKSEIGSVAQKYQALVDFLQKDLRELEDRVMDVAGKARAKTPVYALLDSAIETLSSLRDREQALITERYQAIAQKVEELS
ncbi:ParB/RepB/Spo0J family partition protein [Roseiconus lacunae]|uniref:ParB/RepB/Spo0J family partition protein n=1 Tax=Roseiconus lacunae TaxID=2605694 RepID=UPI001E60107F|nr:ParB/RepB/Spo0J family partition protein [Roseiconus lacunae]MCD0460678.1 ParB/RepB/Spo0J family partition protein [Roseiconus lacunae]